MRITSQGYNLKFIQTHRVPRHDKTGHVRSYIFKFHSPITKLHYVLTADLHQHDFFAIKFYAKQHKALDNRYSKITNKGDIVNILVTCAKTIPYFLNIFPNASFGLIGSRTIDFYADKVEGVSNNQRFRVYSYHLTQLIGHKTFEHRTYNEASSYILLNKNIPDLNLLESDIKSMIINTYPDILNI